MQTVGLVHGDLPQGSSTPWFIRLMLGIVGWIGSFFLLGFIGAGFEIVMRSSFAATIVAIACCGGAYAIFKLASKGDFASQFALATGIVGQILFGVAIFKEFNAGESSIGYLLFFIIEAALTIIMPNFMHRIFTTLGAVGALSIGFTQAGMHGLALPLVAVACAVVWCGEFRLSARLDLWQPVGYGLAIGLLQTAVTSIMGGMPELFGRNGEGWLKHHGNQVGTALVAVIFLAVILKILHDLDISESSTEGITILACATIVMAVSFPTHGLTAAALILILGFAGGNRVLFGLGILAMASFLSHYYYQMKETLLFKSMVLGGLGSLLLLARVVLQQLFPVKEAPRNA